MKGKRVEVRTSVPAVLLLQVPHERRGIDRFSDRHHLTIVGATSGDVSSFSLIIPRPISMTKLSPDRIGRDTWCEGQE